jgi:Low affinity iron permease
MAFGMRNNLFVMLVSPEWFHTDLNTDPGLHGLAYQPLIQAHSPSSVYVALWVALDPHSFDWQSAATVATWVMTLFIQRAEHRDTQAIHAKLDELLRAEGEADDQLAMLDQKEPEEIESHRDRALGPLNRPGGPARKRNPRDR